MVANPWKSSSLAWRRVVEVSSYLLEEQILAIFKQWLDFRDTHGPSYSNHLLRRLLVVDVAAIVDEGLGNSSYVVDLGDGSALVVDPERDPRPYLAELRRRRLRARFVVETHLHADFVSGGRELASEGAEMLAPAGSELAHPHRPLRDEEEVDLGGLTLRVIATPGHTPEHLSYLLVSGSDPVGLLSGGTLMTGGVARTDLLSADQTVPLARAAYQSIRRRLFTLPNELVVYPTHGAGSFCSVGAGNERTTTIGREKSANPLFAGDPDEDAFVERLVAGYGSYPPYFLELRKVNRSGPVVIGPEPAPLLELSPAQVEAAVTDGVEVVDVRGVDDFAAGHVPRSISNPWRAQFATWLGWLIPRRTPLIFVTDDTVRREDLVWAALKVGFENFEGILAGGVEAWQESGRPLSRLTVAETPDAVDGRAVLDVRQASEYASGHLSGAVHAELGSLIGPAEQLPDQATLVHCGHGERAATAASLLLRNGQEDVAVFKGGPGELGDLVTS